MKAISFKNMIIAVLVIGIGNGFVQAGRQEILTMLSKKEAEFDFKDITITEALDNIGSDLGIKIVLSDEAEWKLPNGKITKLSASLKGSLADCLSEILNPFFMRYAVSDDDITIYPRAELEHILGRPNAEKLKLLKNIYAMKLSFDGSFSIENAQGLVRRTFDDVTFLPYDVPKRIAELLKTMSTEKGIAPVYFSSLLEQVCDRYRTPKWYLSGMNFTNQSAMLKLVDEVGYREAVLNQVVDISFEGRRADRADVILKKLAGWTGMELVIEKEEPSWLQEKIVVNMQNIKLRQALRNIVSSVDGKIEINVEDNVMEIYGPMGVLINEPVSAEPKSAGSSGEGYVGKISIPMGQGEHKYYIEFMLRERDLTEELRKLRENKIKEILKKFSKTGNNALEITFNSQPYTILN